MHALCEYRSVRAGAQCRAWGALSPCYRVTVPLLPYKAWAMGKLWGDCNPELVYVHALS